MIVPEPWIVVDEVGSTQTEVARMLAAGERIGVLFAKNQVAGRGRFGRPWQSRAGNSLTLSIAFTPYVGHPMPWLLGMAVAIAAANVTDASLRWPNDLAKDGRKVGGILTELVPDTSGHLVPVVGVGLNLGSMAFEEPIGQSAGYLALPLTPAEVATALAEVIRSLPEPTTWEVLEPLWRARDATPGKRYKLPNGEVAEALSVGPRGELRCRVGGTERVVLAADALFGTT